LRGVSRANMKKNTPQPVIIKKYENRRLYNTLTSQYINQEQVAQLVRDGHNVQVVDAATGEDITRLVLAQIVLEDAKTPDSAFPLDVLRQMIVASGRATQENTLRYMKMMMDSYQNAYRSLPAPMNPFEFLPGHWPTPAAAPGATAGPPPDPPAASATPAGTHEVDELESLLTGVTPKKKTKKPNLRRNPRRKA
jgi:polyhydroxyalkanoate synthesis repressor PhaR